MKGINLPIENPALTVRITDSEFLKLSRYIFENYGIKLPESKRSLLQGRLQKRLKTLQFQSFSQYITYVFSKEGKDEIINMIDAVSTNKTDFFRENVHFEIMTNTVLPEFFKSNFNKPLKIWCAASSTGEEPYSIAVTVEEYMKNNRLRFPYTVLGTDISTQVLIAGKKAVYAATRVDRVPVHIKHNYFLKSKDKSNPQVRVVKKIREKVSFQRLNLMDNYYSLPDMYDIIFCRNVLIYFEKATQEKVVSRLCDKLNKGGILFLGHSESIVGFKLPLEQIRSTVYRKI